MGSLLALSLGIQIVTGVTLAMHYDPNTLAAFDSVEHGAFFLKLCALKYSSKEKIHSVKQNTQGLTNKPFSRGVASVSSAVGLESKSISNDEFLEWLRGLTDGEGCFLISENKSGFTFKFMIYMHKDDAPMLKYVCTRLGVGKVYVYDHFAYYAV